MGVGFYLRHSFIKSVSLKPIHPHTCQLKSMIFARKEYFDGFVGELTLEEWGLKHVVCDEVWGLGTLTPASQPEKCAHVNTAFTFRDIRSLKWTRWASGSDLSTFRRRGSQPVVEEQLAALMMQLEPIISGRDTAVTWSPANERRTCDVVSSFFYIA